MANLSLRKRGRPRQEPFDTKRRRILMAARTALSERDYQEVSLDDVAKRAKVVKGTLYLYFKDKEDLFAAALEDLIDDTVSRMALLAKQGLSPLEYLRRLTQETLDFLDEHKDFLVQFSMEKPTLCGARMGQNLQERFKKHISDLAKAVEACIREGSLRKHDAFTGALFLIFLFRMFLLRKILFGKNKPLRDEADGLMELFLRGVGTKR